MPQRPLVLAVKSVRYARQITNWRSIAAAAWRGQDVTCLQLRNGLVIEGSPRSQMIQLYKEIWWRDVYRLRAEPLRAGATVIDIGASIGMFSLYAAAYARAAVVLAFEPFPESFDLLSRNSWRNSLNVRPFQIAVAGTHAPRQMYVGPCYGWNTLWGGGEPMGIDRRRLLDASGHL